MKTLIVTVAGTATRFNRDTEKDTLKCLYYRESPEYSLLYQILDKAENIDRYIIVGGYLYEQLEEFAEQNLSCFKSKIDLVYNPYYREYGSGYSLINGIEALPEGTEEVVFVEGDLFFDRRSFSAVLESCRDVITVNREFILSDKAVVLYLDEAGQVHYLYDVNHKSLFIPEPFQAVYNSAQMWKFVSPGLLTQVARQLTEKQRQGTNLEIIQGYFGGLSSRDYEILPVELWYNCNTVADYELVYSKLKK